MGYSIGVKKPVIIMVQDTVTVPADFIGRLYYRYNPEKLDLIPQQLQGYFQGAIDSLVANRVKPCYFVEAFENRAKSGLETCFKTARHQIDILTTNLDSLVTAHNIAAIHDRLKTESRLRVRILTLDPESNFASHRARQLGISARHFRDQLRESLEQVSDILHDHPEECKINTYDEFPTQIAFRIDHSIFFQVVSATGQSRNNIMLLFHDWNAGVSQSILSHFETVWGRNSTSIFHRR
jgi:hypothetical protein